MKRVIRAKFEDWQIAKIDRAIELAGIKSRQAFLEEAAFLFYASIRDHFDPEAFADIDDPSDATDATDAEVIDDIVH